MGGWSLGVIDVIVDQVDPGALRRSRKTFCQRDVVFGSPSDEACRWPGCDKPAYGCDIDHTVPYPIGPTHASNIKCLCRFQNRASTDLYRGPTKMRLSISKPDCRIVEGFDYLGARSALDEASPDPTFPEDLTPVIVPAVCLDLLSLAPFEHADHIAYAAGDVVDVDVAGHRCGV